MHRVFSLFLNAMASHSCGHLWPDERTFVNDNKIVQSPFVWDHEYNALVWNIYYFAHTHTHKPHHHTSSSINHTPFVGQTLVTIDTICVDHTHLGILFHGTHIIHDESTLFFHFFCHWVIWWKAKSMAKDNDARGADIDTTAWNEEENKE